MSEHRILQDLLAAFGSSGPGRVAVVASANGAVLGDSNLVQFIVPTWGNSNNVIILPNPQPQMIVVIAGAATGGKLRPKSSTTTINEETELTVDENQMVIAICESATSWKVLTIADNGSLGGVGTAEALNYQSRVVAAGGSMTAAGFAAVKEVFAAAHAAGVTVESGWVFGSEVNVSRNLQINLVEGKPSITPIGTPHADTTLSAGMLGIRMGGANEGYKTPDGQGLIGHSVDSSILILGSYSGDPDVFGQTAPVALKQGAGASSGNFWLLGASGGSNAGIDWPSGISDLSGNGVAGGDATRRELLVDPMMYWLHRKADNTARGIHAGENIAGAYFSVDGDCSDKTLYLGEYGVAGDAGFAMLIRFDGDIDDATRAALFERVYAAWRTYGKAVLVVGNSVTIPGVTVANVAWVKQLQRWGVYNNCIVARRAQGARKLAYFAPTGYTLPGPPSDSEIATMPVNVIGWFAANVLVNDEQQNAVANGQPWSNFLHTHNAIVDYFADMNTDMRAVICTQMPWPPYQDLELTTPANYAYVVSDNRQRFLTASQAARSATLSDFANIKTAVADVYTLFNLGWGSSDDGNAADPVNDLPKGDVTKFIDLAHPNQTGQDLMFATYRDAITAALAL